VQPHLADDPLVLAGDLLDGRYEIERRIGAGGMSVVYRALDRQTGARVAVKVVREGDPHLVRRFDREAAMLARLDHPSIARYLGHGISPTGACYLVMEWIEGSTLSDRLDRTGLSVAESVTVARACAEALAAAHALHMVHRDVKPSNVLLAGGGIDRVKLIDFGLAREARPADRMTHTGMLVGTPGYMAPEQARGESGIDARVDVFALGCVLYECLTGEAAFAGPHFRAVQAKVLLGEPAAVTLLCPELPAPLANLVRSLLAKRAEDRPADAAAVAEALAAIAAEAALPDEPRRPRVRGEGPTPRRPAPGPRRDHRCMVLVAEVDADDRSWPEDRLAEATLAEAALHQGCAVRLADGSMVVVLGGRASAEVAVRAARCALALRERLPGALVTVTTSRAAEAPEGDSLIDRGVQTLCGEAIDAAVDPDSAALTAVVLDAETAGLLGRGFDIERRGDRHYLRGTVEESSGG
jgi:hypothetical protein